MKRSPRSRRARRRETSPNTRARRLAAFEQSGMSAAAIPRQHRIGYSTICAWRQRPPEAVAVPDLVQVELLPGPRPMEVVVEIGAQARIRLHSIQQLEVVAGLLQHLNGAKSCSVSTPI